MAQFTIRWNDLEHRFEPATLGLRLVMKVKGVETPIKVVKTTFEPDHIIKLEKDDSRSTDTRIAWFAKLEDEVIKAKDFYQRVMEPVQLKVEIQQRDPPADGSTPETYTQTSTIKVKVPPATIHWFDVDDHVVEDQDPLEVEADGEDELNLEVYLERWNTDVGSMWEDDSVEFSHWTGPTLKPDIFGAHPDDVPDKVADPESGNRRQRSRWMSLLELPNDAHPEITLPVIGHIRVKAWPTGDIASRSPNHLQFNGDAKGVLAEQRVPVNLVPVKLEARLSEPQEIIPADAEPIDIVLEIWRVRKHEKAKKGQVSWEFSKGEQWAEGGELSHDGANLVEADNGEVRITFTPPELWYQPGGKYTKELVVYNGSGASRIEIGRFTLLLGPALDVEIDMEKLGLEQETNGLVQRDPGECPVEINGWLEHEATAAGSSAKHRVAHARVKLTFVGESDEVRTEKELPVTTAEGKFTVALPELEKHGLRMPEIQRILELDVDELPEIVLDEAAEEKITDCESRIRKEAPHDWFRGYSSELDRKLLTFRLPYAGHLCQRPPEDRHKTIDSADLFRVGAIYGPMYQKLFYSSVSNACEQFTSIMGEIFGMVITAVDFGEKLVHGLAWGARKAGGAWTALASILEVATSRLGWVLEAMGSAARQFGAWVGPLARRSLEAITTALLRAKESIVDILTEIRGGALDVTAELSQLFRTVGGALVDFVRFGLNATGDMLGQAATMLGPWLETLGAGLKADGVAYRAGLADLMATIQRLWGSNVAAKSYGEMTLAKVAETLYKELINLLMGLLGGASTPLANALQVFGSPVQLLNPYGVDSMANDVIAWQLPGDIQAARDRQQHAAEEMLNGLHERAIDQIDSDVWFNMTDVILTLVQFFVWFIGAFTGVGVLVVGPLMKPIEQGVAALKILMRSPKLIADVSAGIGICLASDTDIRLLTRP